MTVKHSPSHRKMASSNLDDAGRSGEQNWSVPVEGWAYTTDACQLWMSVSVCMQKEAGSAVLRVRYAIPGIA